MTMTLPLLVAVDGPAASGKGTLARRLAAHYALPHLDTGLLYRGVGAVALHRGVDLADEGAVAAIAAALDPATLDAGQLRGRDMGEAASRVAALPAVRRALLKLQRDFAAAPEGAVLDGRDVGTVICPDAVAKLYVTASAAERARRRLAELIARGEATAADGPRILADIETRDVRDAGRADAPLRQAPDACLLDTTDLDIEAAVRVAVALVDAARGARG
jgi:cytidylate kinase